MLEQKVALEGEPLLAAVRDLAAALPLHVQRTHDARWRRCLDLQGVEVLLQTAHVIEADLPWRDRREVPLDRDPAPDTDQKQPGPHQQEQTFTRHAAWAA